MSRAFETLQLSQVHIITDFECVYLQCLELLRI